MTGCMAELFERFLTDRMKCIGNVFILVGISRFHANALQADRGCQMRSGVEIWSRNLFGEHCVSTNFE